MYLVLVVLPRIGVMLAALAAITALVHSVRDVGTDDCVSLAAKACSAVKAEAKQGASFNL